MAVTEKPPGKGRLGTRFRGKLASAYGQRAHHESNLWYVYSPRTNSDWVLRGDLEWDHFVLSESDVRIKNIDFSPAPVAGVFDDGTHYRTILDAVVTYHDGAIEWREVKPLDASRSRTERQHRAQLEATRVAKVAYTRWTEVELHANPLKLANWRRAIAWMAAARDYPLALQRTDLAGYLHIHETVTLGDLALYVGDAAFPLFMAAALRSVQSGDCLSDLDINPLSNRTVLTRAGGA